MAHLTSANFLYDLKDASNADCKQRMKTDSLRVQGMGTQLQRHRFSENYGSTSRSPSVIAQLDAFVSETNILYSDDQLVKATSWSISSPEKH